MAQRSSVKTLRVGAFILVALSAMVVFVFTLGGDSAFLGKKVKYRALFKSTSGLYEGDPVLLTGVEVGNVSRIGFAEGLDEKRIVVEISVSKSVQDRIRQDTRARIGSASLIYGKVVELSMGSPDQPLIREGSEIPADEAGLFGTLMDTTQKVLDDLRSVLGKIDHGDGVISVLLNEPLEMRSTVRNLSVTTDRLSRILARIERGDGPLGAMISDSVDFKKTLKDFESATSDLSAITSSLKGKESLMGRMINDPQYGKEITEDLKTTLQALANITTKIDTGYGTAGQLVNDPSIYYGLQNVVLGMEKSWMTKWLINGRRKAGEKEREKIQSDER
jgi:phospholipid/cholesterol/gamma-HCH transport system substrate-binding protein